MASSMLSSEGRRGLDELPLGVSSGTDVEPDGAGGELLGGSESYVVVDSGASEANDNREYEVDAELLEAPECIR